MRGEAAHLASPASDLARWARGRARGHARAAWDGAQLSEGDGLADDAAVGDAAARGRRQRRGRDRGGRLRVPLQRVADGAAPDGAPVEDRRRGAGGDDFWAAPALLPAGPRAPAARGPDADVPIIGVPSSSEVGSKPDKAAQYHVYRVKKSDAGFALNAEVRGYDAVTKRFVRVDESLLG